MNQLQEVILDRLVGAAGQEIDEHAGPVGLAWQALQDADLLGDAPTALSLGYPLIFSRVLEAACAMLETVEEKRQLAIAVFAEIAPRMDAVDHLAHRQLVQVALWCARRVHPLICRADCPFLQDAAEQIDLYLRNGRDADLELSPSNQQFFACKAPNAMIIDKLAMTAMSLRSIGFRSVENALQAARADRSQQCPENASSAGAEYAGRLAAHCQGVAGATQFCVAFAHELGM